MHLKLHLFPYPSILTCVLGAQKNHLIETFFFEYPQHIMFWLRNKKNNFQIRTFIWRPSKGEKLFPYTCIFTYKFVIIKEL